MTKIISKKTPDGLLLYDVNTDSVHALNATAELIYQLHEKGKGIDEIKSALDEKFTGVSEGRLEQDVRSVLREMSGKGLIREK